MEFFHKQQQIETMRSTASLTVTINFANNVKRGSFFTTNSSICAKLGKEKRYSSIKKDSLNPVWNETLDPFDCCPFGEELVIKLYDNGTLGKKLFEEISLFLDSYDLPNGFLFFLLFLFFKYYLFFFFFIFFILFSNDFYFFLGVPKTFDIPFENKGEGYMQITLNLTKK